MSETASSPKKFDRSIVEGPLNRAVWGLAWPAMVQNVMGGIQGIIDQAMVGNLVGYTGNAAIGVSLQIFILVIVFCGDWNQKPFGIACWQSRDELIFRWVGLR